jgi:16S rRNA (guanine527-N7)-methyltransferase
MDFTEFWTICSANGIVLEIHQLESIKRYHKELLYWNDKVNLISRKDEDNLLDRHILHSLSLLKYIEIPKKSRCLDVGTGGGLPGIPITIAREDLRMLLVDSVTKKIKITAMLAKHTGLKFIEARAARVETLSIDNNYKRYFDFVFARSVAKIRDVVFWTQNLIKPFSKIVFFKGGDVTDEISAAKEKFDKLEVEIIPILMRGCNLFKDQDKKLVVCSFN